jgi:3-oxoacyl-[acyl-carrier-protein] synthase II
MPAAVINRTSRAILPTPPAPMTDPQSPLVITGISSISGFGTETGALLEGLLAGRTTVRPYDGAGASRARLAAQIDGFDPAAFITPGKLRRIDRVGRVAIAGCRLALTHAGVDTAVASDDVGVVLGSYTAGLHSLVEYLDRLMAQGATGASALDFSNTVGNAAASLCGIELRLRGPNVTVNNKEASGLAAVAQAASVLWSDRARAIVTGGVDDFEPTFFAIHDRFGVLATDGGEGEASRPFDRRRNGFVLGAGGFLVVLETAASAGARGAPRHAQLRSVVGSAAPARLNDWPRDAAAVARGMRTALDRAGVSAAEVALVFAAANSTPALDRTEAEAIADVFGSRTVPVVSLKGALGESGAAAAAGLVIAPACLRDGVIPPTAGCDEPDLDCPVNVAATTRRFERRPGQVALINSIASGGTIYTAVVSA